MVQDTVQVSTTIKVLLGISLFKQAGRTGQDNKSKMGKRQGHRLGYEKTKKRNTTSRRRLEHCH